MRRPGVSNNEHRKFVSAAQAIYQRHRRQFISTTQKICFSHTGNLSQPHKQFALSVQVIYFSHTSLQILEQYIYIYILEQYIYILREAFIFFFSFYTSIFISTLGEVDKTIVKEIVEYIPEAISFDEEGARKESRDTTSVSVTKAW